MINIPGFMANGHYLWTTDTWNGFPPLSLSTLPINFLISFTKWKPYKQSSGVNEMYRIRVLETSDQVLKTSKNIFSSYGTAAKTPRNYVHILGLHFCMHKVLFYLPEETFKQQRSKQNWKKKKRKRHQRQTNFFNQLTFSSSVFGIYSLHDNNSISHLYQLPPIQHTHLFRKKFEIHLQNNDF